MILQGWGSYHTIQKQKTVQKKERGKYNDKDE